MNLKSFFTTEKLENDEQWKCPRCNCLRDAHKKLQINKLAPYIIIQLKRFEQTYYNFKRNDTEVFINEKINFSNFTINNNKSKYKLYAIVNHFKLSKYGNGLNSGHYTSYCKNPLNNKWYDFDDNKVELVDDFNDDLDQESNYILFYMLDQD